MKWGHKCFKKTNGACCYGRRCSGKGNVDTQGKTPKAKHRCLAVGVKWARRWDSAAPASDAQPTQLKYLDVTRVTWPAWYPGKWKHGASVSPVSHKTKGGKKYMCVYIYLSH